MLSRVADAIYWLNRYVERAENIARFVDVNLNLMLDAPLSSQWKPLVLTTGDQGWFEEHYGDYGSESVISFLTNDINYPNSILSCLYKARENARSIREIISSEMWEQVNSFYHFVKDMTYQDRVLELHGFFDQVKQSGHLFAGIMDATMSHNEAWNFGCLGRYLERADKITRMLDVKYFILLPNINYIGSTLDEIQWISLLKSASAYEMYRKSKEHKISPSRVAEFLILDPEFPRSLKFCLLKADESLHYITENPIGSWNNSVERALGKIRSELDYITIEDIIEEGLHEFLDKSQTTINDIGNLIFKTYFA